MVVEGWKTWTLKVQKLHPKKKIQGGRRECVCMFRNLIFLGSRDLEH